MIRATRTNKRLAILPTIALVLIGSFVIPLALMNLTPGHFGFPDNDGCACFVAYTTHPSLPTCERTRPIHCDGLWSQQVLAYLSFLDFNK
jgi:hypothetical protein